MFHLLSFSGTQTANASLLPLTPTPDQQIPSNQNNQFIMPSNMQIMAAFLLGVGMGRSRINTPSMRAVALPEVYPLTVSATVPSLPQLEYFYNGGPVIPRNDPLELDTSETSGANSTQWGLIWLSDQIRNQPSGPPYKVLATSPGVAGGSFNWQAQALTLTQVLGAGVYAVTGMNIVGANMIAGRLVFVGGGYRPGVIASNLLGSYPNPLFASGQLGEMGRFDSNAQPTAEILAPGATGAIQWYLDLVKVA